jgi:hypothetical protein
MKLLLNLPTSMAFASALSLGLLVIIAMILGEAWEREKRNSPDRD